MTRRSTRGVTVVELVVALVILAILAGLTVVTVRAITARTVENTAAADLAALSRAAVAHATAASQEVAGPDDVTAVLRGPWTTVIETAPDGPVPEGGQLFVEAQPQRTLLVGPIDGRPHGTVAVAVARTTRTATAVLDLTRPVADEGLATPDARRALADLVEQQGDVLDGSPQLDLSGPWYDADETVDVGRSFHAAALLPDGRLAVSGGFTDDGPSGTVGLFHPTTGWEELPDLPAPRFDHAMTVESGRLVVVGGVVDGEATDEVLVLDLAAQGGWVAGEPLPQPRQGVRAVVFGTERHLLGDGPTLRFPIGASDPAWQPLVPEMQPEQHRTLHAATVTGDGRVVVSGGIDTIGTPLAGVFVYDMTDPTATVEMLPELPHPRYGHASVIVGSTVYVIGGQTAWDTSSTDVLLLQLDDLDEGWQPGPALSRPRTGLAATTTSAGQLWAVGGVDLTTAPPSRSVTVEQLGTIAAP